LSRLIVFDRRGNGMSDGATGARPLEEQVDDVHAVIDAVDSEQPVLVSTVSQHRFRAEPGPGYE
jgi:pimeloyl-ACP methyl ester carboxylesterase